MGFNSAFKGLNSVRQHHHFITQGNYKATCFDYRLVILRPILSIVSQDPMHMLQAHRDASIQNKYVLTFSTTFA